MKKVVSIFLVVSILLSTFTVVYAQNFDKKVKKEKSEFVYNYKGIKISCDTQLTKEQLSFMYNSFVLKMEKPKNNDDLVMQVVIPPEDDGSIMLAGPVRTTYDNGVINTVLNASVNTLVYAVDAVFWVKISWQASAAAVFLQSCFLSDVEDWVESQPDEVYTEKWIWKSYSSYHNCYIVNGSIVDFSDSNYTNPIEVQTYQIRMED